jgi:hypothetical protein
VQGLEIQPKPAFVVKTLLQPANVKLFLNVCTHEALPEPKTVTRLDAEGKEVEGLSIPVAVGPRRVGGKGGEDAMTYDTCVNPVVMKEVEADDTGGYRDFVCNLVIQYVSQKLKKPKEAGGEADEVSTVDQR